MNKKIKPNMKIGEILGRWPQLGEVLSSEYGFHCVGCSMAGMESLEEGARVHGMDETEIKVMVENLNELKGIKKP
jgi:hybrid cluster-associated redox disulfide protein